MSEMMTETKDTVPPAPRPWMTRAAISHLIPVAVAHRMLPRKNMAMAVMKLDLRPNMSLRVQ
jgi:hypothetical protein